MTALRATETLSVEVTQSVFASILDKGFTLKGKNLLPLAGGEGVYFERRLLLKGGLLLKGATAKGANSYLLELTPFQKGLDVYESKQ